jgi:hypothetical protein
VSTHKQTTTPEDRQLIADHARQHLPCDDCGAKPGQPCSKTGNGRTVCIGRYIGAAIEVRQAAKAARRTPEEAAAVAALFATLPRLTHEQIEAGRSPNGGFGKEQLADWGVPWPPPTGWLNALRGEDDSNDRTTP